MVNTISTSAVIMGHDRRISQTPDLLLLWQIGLKVRIETLLTARGCSITRSMAGKSFQLSHSSIQYRIEYPKSTLCLSSSPNLHETWSPVLCTLPVSCITAIIL